MPQPLRNTIGNLDTFSGALARNSDRLDGIVAGLERMTGGAAAKARTAVYDLALPRDPQGRAEGIGRAARRPRPDSVLAALDSDKIQSVTPAGVSAALPDAQWSDTLSKLAAGEDHPRLRGRGRGRRRQPSAGRRDGRRPAPHRRAQVPALARPPTRRRDRILRPRCSTTRAGSSIPASFSRPLPRRGATRLPPRPPSTRPSARPSSISSTGPPAPSARMRQRRRLPRAIKGRAQEEHALRCQTPPGG